MEDDFIACLSRHPFCRGFTSGQLHLLARTLQPLLLPAKTFLFREGDAANSFFLTLRGTLNVWNSRSPRDARRISSGMIVGLEALIEQTPRRFNCEADKNDVLLLRGGSRHFDRLFRTDNALSERFIRHVLPDILVVRRVYAAT